MSMRVASAVADIFREAADHIARVGWRNDPKQLGPDGPCCIMSAIAVTNTPTTEGVDPPWFLARAILQDYLAENCEQCSIVDGKLHDGIVRPAAPARMVSVSGHNDHHIRDQGEAILCLRDAASFVLYRGGANW